MKAGRLTSAERATPLWHELETMLLQRLDRLRKDMDADLNPVDTAKLRGRIAEIKALLGLAEDRPTPNA